MKPGNPLPYDTSVFNSAEEYIDSLLRLVTSHELLRTLCGGVHVLDFFTSTPDLYSRLLPQEWRDFFAGHEMMDILDFLMREDIDNVTWQDGPAPPASLLEYVGSIRRHLLNREPKSNQCARNRTQKKLSRQVTIGMNVKKVHEVGIFSSYVDDLANHISSGLPDGEHVTHLLDLGSGQSYLGRALASKPYERNVIAVERKSHNTERAGELDVKARLVEKNWKWRNKKAFRAGLVPSDKDLHAMGDLPTPPPEKALESHGSKIVMANDEMPEETKRRIQHVEHQVCSGDLTEVIPQITPDSPDQKNNLIVISLHSCGNLLHHGLRCLILNPSVKAVALVGCCYNLLTERLGPATYKHASLFRSTTNGHQRLAREGERRDPDGFPMSERFCNYDAGDGGKGVRLNITARMMAVQAPANWGPKDSESFFTRHFYRALLQKVFLDYGVVGPPCEENVGTLSASGHSSGGTPILIGTLPKSAYASFPSYVHAALAKLYDDANQGPIIKSKMSGVTDAELNACEERFKERKKDLSVVWSLMAFSAGVIEAAIVVDRWLWLREQEEVDEAWVEPLFEYGISPRNLVVVGVKK